MENILTILFGTFIVFYSFKSFENDTVTGKIFYTLLGLVWIWLIVSHGMTIGARVERDSQQKRAVENGMAEYSKKGELIMSANLHYVISGNTEE